MAKRKASLGLGAVLEEKEENQIVDVTSSVQLKPAKIKENIAKAKTKQSIPIYVNPLLHEALHVLVFSERHKKTSFQTLFIEALDMLLKQRGLPSVEDLSSGEKTINL